MYKEIKIKVVANLGPITTLFFENGLRKGKYEISCVGSSLKNESITSYFQNGSSFNQYKEEKD